MRRDGIKQAKSGWVLLSVTLAAVGLTGCGSSEPPPAVSINQPGETEAQNSSGSASSSPVRISPETPATGSSQQANPAQAAATPTPPPPTSFSNTPSNPAARGGANTAGPATDNDQPLGQTVPGETVSAAELTAQVASEPIPQGDAEAILRYMNDLTSVPFPNNATPEELRQFAKMVYTNVLKGADQLLNVPNATSQQRRAAVQYKFNAYEMLSSIEPEKTETLHRERIQFAESMAQVRDPEVSRLARLFLFETMLAEFAQGNEELFQPVLEDAKYIISDQGADIMHYQVAQNAATVFAQMGHSDQALEILGMMKKSFTGSENQRLAAQAEELDDLMLQYQIVGSMMDAVNGNDEAAQQMLGHLERWIALRGTETLEPLQLLSNIEMQMEDFGRIETAKRLTAMMVKHYGNHSDPKVARSVAVSAENAEKRLALLGNKFELEGVYLDGSKFDWEQYRGKYVLVDFWASWCSACIDEMDTIKAAHAKYRQRGFEVVGINLDDDNRARDQFFQHHQIPWATIVSGNPDASGMNDPNATRLGVEALPFIVLVDPEGKVVEMNPRGERLEEILDSIFSQQPAIQAAEAQGQLELKSVR